MYTFCLKYDDRKQRQARLKLYRKRTTVISFKENCMFI